MKKTFETCFVILLLCLLCIKASGEKRSSSFYRPPDKALPVLTCADISQARSATDTIMRFLILLDKAAKTDASAKYILEEGTALSPRDFIASSGTVTVPAGQTLAHIDVSITGDNLRQPDLQFIVQFSEPKNCVLGVSSSKGTIITSDGTYLPTDTAGYCTPAGYPGYDLAWHDEFSGKSINDTTWNFETGGHGWGNHELQYYTGRTQNAFQSNGNLVIEARNERFSGNNYTSARMTTQNKKVFTFGRIDIRAKLPVTKGIWPALWMLGSTISSVDWPACGEIDIMELIGLDPKKVYGTAHFANRTGGHDSRGGNYSLALEDFSQRFHVFSIVWVQDSIKWLVDEHLYFSLANTSIGTAPYPFNKDFFFIFNVAVGGDWPGSPGAGSIFPQRMFVDYIRVFR